jgi:hypothetical protein
MLEYAKKIYDCMLKEFDNLRQSEEGFSPEQRTAFNENSVHQLETYCFQLMTIVECLSDSRQSSTAVSQTTSIIIPVDYKLQYTGPKVGLTEVAYSFAKMGVFNNGKASVRMINQYFEKVFFTELSNYTATFQDIRNRKKGNTIFIDSMKKSLEDWIEELD